MFMAGSPDRFRCYVVSGGFAFKADYPNLRWGPRIDIPDGPDGSPGTRFVVVIGGFLGEGKPVYLAPALSYTLHAAEAHMFNRVDAERAVAWARDRYPDAMAWIEPIDDMAEFIAMSESTP
jgi:hypothetical protein